MDWRAVTGVLAGLITFAATIPYMAAAAKGTIRPSVVAWSGGALLNGIAFAAQIVGDPSWAASLAFASFFYCSTVAVLSIRYGFDGFSKLDKTCIALAALALIGWALTDEPLVALTLSILADAIVCVPMVVKTWRDPKTELMSRWVICTGASLLGAASAQHFNAVTLAWPLFLVSLNATMAALCLRGRETARHAAATVVS